MPHHQTASKQLQHKSGKKLFFLCCAANRLWVCLVHLCFADRWRCRLNKRENPPHSDANVAAIQSQAGELRGQLKYASHTTIYTQLYNVLLLMKQDL